MDFLNRIIESKRVRLEREKSLKPLSEVRFEASRRREHAQAHALAAALEKTDRVNIIAEFKRRSPSKGEIRPNADPVAMATAYAAGGAAAISVLTEEDYFAGSVADLNTVREATALPILRKDFIFDDYQAYQSAAAGADALLLIVASLEDDALLRLRLITEDELGMDALVEVHDEAELMRATRAGAKMIGVNNRDLKTFDVSLETSVRLAAAAPPRALLISESGIESAGRIKMLQAVGYRGFLIGERLMRADDPEALLKEFAHV